jgi:Transposase domain (DUF772)
LADRRRELFPGELFEDLFVSGTGRPPVPADVMAAAMVLKELEGLSDRQAADALRCDVRWKVAAGLPLDDPGVHYSVFTFGAPGWGAANGAERIKEAVAEVVAATGALAGRRRRALDSRLLDDAVAQDTVTQLISAIDPGEEDGTWRIAQRVVSDRFICTVDPEARHLHNSR